MIGVIAAMGGEIERYRKTFLPGGEIATIEGVGILGRGESGILPDRPRLGDIHGGVGPAQDRRDTRPGLKEIDAFKVCFAVAGLYRDAFGREPGRGVAFATRRRSRCE